MSTNFFLFEWVCLGQDDERFLVSGCFLSWIASFELWVASPGFSFKGGSGFGIDNLVGRSWHWSSILFWMFTDVGLWLSCGSLSKTKGWFIWPFSSSFCLCEDVKLRIGEFKTGTVWKKTGWIPWRGLQFSPSEWFTSRDNCWSLEIGSMFCHGG